MPGGTRGGGGVAEPPYPPQRIVNNRRAEGEAHSEPKKKSTTLESGKRWRGGEAVRLPPPAPPGGSTLHPTAHRLSGTPQGKAPHRQVGLGTAWSGTRSGGAGRLPHRGDVLLVQEPVARVVQRLELLGQRGRGPEGCRPSGGGQPSLFHPGCPPVANFSHRQR